MILTIMAHPSDFPQHKLVIPVLYSKESLFEKLIFIVESNFGLLDYQSPVLNFDFTDYYNEEMGAPIKRIILSVEKLLDPSLLAEIKLKTNDIEAQFAEGERRKVNLDPGILGLSRFVLATTKEGPHRIPLKDGIWAELTLRYEKGEFKSLPWTYLDYQSEAYKTILNEIRIIYRKQKKSQQS